MGPEHTRRPKRHPLTPEEVADIVAHKKRREHVRLHKFRRTKAYKALNVFNILCFCLYLELISCFYGPCLFSEHRALNVQARFGDEYRSGGEAILKDVTMQDENGKNYVFVINEFVQPPVEGSVFFVGRDFLMKKKMKGLFEGSDKSYRLFAASPILFLCFLVLVASLIGFLYNLNENVYSLQAISVLNALTFLGILVL